MLCPRAHILAHVRLELPVCVAVALEDLGSDKSSAEQPTDELVEVITAGLAELCRMKPPNPAEWLAEWMIANRDPEKRARKKLAETYGMQ